MPEKDIAGQTLGNQFKELRKRSGLTAEAVARRVGVSRPAVSRWETGRRSPEDPKTVRRLLNILQAEPEERIEIFSSLGITESEFSFQGNSEGEFVLWLSDKIDGISRRQIEIERMQKDLDVLRSELSQKISERNEVV